MTKALDYKTIVWNIDTRDWAHRNKNDIIREIKSCAGSGSIILFHDFISNNSDTPEILETILPCLFPKAIVSSPFPKCWDLMKLYDCIYKKGTP